MKKLVIIALLAASPAFAQQTPPPVEQAMGMKIVQEVQFGVQCNAEMITVKAELAKAQVRLKELEPPKEAK